MVMLRMINTITKCDHCGEKIDKIMGNKGWISISLLDGTRIVIHRAWNDTSHQIEYVNKDVHFCSEQCLIYWLRNFDMISE